MSDAINGHNVDLNSSSWSAVNAASWNQVLGLLYSINK